MSEVEKLTPDEIDAAKSSKHFGSTSWGLKHTQACAPLAKSRSCAALTSITSAVEPKRSTPVTLSARSKPRSTM